jgi:hypothetical protein
MKAPTQNFGLTLTVLLWSASFFVQPLTARAQTTNQVLSLNGVDRYVTVPDSPALRLTSGDFSIMAWVWLNAYDDFNSVILAKRAPGSQQGWMLVIGGTGQGAEARKPNFIVSEIADPRVYGSTEFGTNRWQHIAVVYRAASSNATLYLDGVLAGASTVPPPLSTSSPLYLGRDSKAAQNFLNGNLDEVSIWSRAFDLDDINLMKSCPLSGAEPNLVAYWNFDGGAVTDASGHGHNGTPVPGPNIVSAFNDNSLHAGCGAPRFTIYSRSAAGLPRFGFIGVSDWEYRIDASSNLLDWTPLIILPAQGTNAVEFIDPASAILPRRFYRAVLP